MPILDLEPPPNPSDTALSPSPGPEPPVAPARLRSQHFGEMEQHELVQMLDTLQDDRARSQFRESIYISVFFYIALFWFLLYGPRFHPPQVAPIATKKTEEQLTSLTVPSDLQKYMSRNAAPPSARRAAPIPAPKPEPKVEPRPAPRVETRRPAPQPRPAPTPKAVQPTPPVQSPPVNHPVIPAPTQPVQPRQNLPSAPQPSNIPDAPAPSRQTGRPNFNTSGTPGDALADAIRPSRGGGGGGAAGPGVGRAGIATGYQILSDTQGVDFEPYIRRLLAIIRAAWIPLLPEETYPPLSKQGVTLIRFGISKDGTLLQPHLDGTSGDRAIDMAAWGSLQANGKFPPLPSAFTGPELDLRIQFEVNRGRRPNAE